MSSVEVGNLAERNQESSGGFTVETDATGQRWRVNPDGGRLKMGNTVNGDQSPGAPKKEARALYALNGLAAAKRDAKVLASDLPDDHPAVERAKERGARVGIGYKDEVALQDKEAVLKALARATLDAAANLSDAQASRLLEVMASELGIE